MKQSKKDNLPFILLTAFSVLFFFKEPSIASSIIMLGLSALCGYKYYQDSLVQPDYSENFKKEINYLKHELQAVSDNYRELKAEYGKITLEKANTPKKSFDFQF